MFGRFVANPVSIPTSGLPKHPPAGPTQHMLNSYSTKSAPHHVITDDVTERVLAHGVVWNRWSANCAPPKRQGRRSNLRSPPAWPPPAIAKTRNTARCAVAQQSESCLWLRLSISGRNEVNHKGRGEGRCESEMTHLRKTLGDEGPSCAR